MSVELPERYKLGSHIANGGMAAVWEAEDELLGRCVAVKVLALHLAEDSVNVRRFEREARAAAKLSAHPNVVTVYDVGEHAGRAFITMERMPGGSVADRLRSGRPDRAQALAWVRDAAAALDFAHSRGIVHRDVKPANLLVDAAERVRVADFGIARIATEDTVTGTGQLIGTAAYLSPEQVGGQPASAASDRYSLGIVAFELLTGRRPFGGDHLAAQAREHLETDPPSASERAPDLPAAVDPVLRRALAKDPGDRWPTATAFVEALDGALSEPKSLPTAPIAPPEPPTTRTVPVSPRRSPRVAAPAPVVAEPAAATPPERPHRAWLPVAAVIVALALAGGLFALLLSSGGGDSPKTASATHQRSTSRRAKTTRSTTTPAHTQSQTQTTSTTQATTPTTSTSTTTPAASGSAELLQSRGHALVDSAPTQAIPLLQQSIGATGKTTNACLQPTGSCLTYAYALYDLGRALRVAGRPQEAIPILRDRLRIAIGQSIVQTELSRAEAQLNGGESPTAPTQKKTKR